MTKQDKKERQAKEEKDRKEREFQRNRKRVYAENFPKLYNHCSASELVKIYNLLDIMHKYNFATDPFGGRIITMSLVAFLMHGMN